MEKLNILEKKQSQTKKQRTYEEYFFIGFLFFILGMGTFSLIIFEGGTEAFMTDGQCELLVNNATNNSFQQGVIYGSQSLQQAIVDQGVECKPIPFEYENKTLNLIVAECLEGVQNG